MTPLARQPWGLFLSTLLWTSLERGVGSEFPATLGAGAYDGGKSALEIGWYDWVGLAFLLMSL